ncbi:MAG: (Fe-S)-binding protein [Anaerolineae bacterium]|nr:Fe-S cluster protein [Anaerolineae bacterium]MDW8098293.1 (Fe-S)-binding protein [Anaerolineae bacterium]
MLIETYDLEVFTPPCEPGAERFSAIARLTADIREVFPYLNATLRGAIYEPAVPALRWTKGGRYVTFQPYQIAVSDIEDRDAAIKEVERLVKLVNRTWEQRAEIEPSYETRHRPMPLEVHRLLPQTNCKQCGQPTCFIFALKLVIAQAKLEECPLLFEPQYAEQLAKLQHLIVEVPAIG